MEAIVIPERAECLLPEELEEVFDLLRTYAMRGRPQTQEAGTANDEHSGS